jgi:hypothetical protein
MLSLSSVSSFVFPASSDTCHDFSLIVVSHAVAHVYINVYAFLFPCMSSVVVLLICSISMWLLYSIELLLSSFVTTFVHVDVHSIVNVHVCHIFISVFVGQSIISHVGFIESTTIFGLCA